MQEPMLHTVHEAARISALTPRRSIGPSERARSRRSDSAADTAFPRPEPATRANPAVLTDRQMEILQLLADGQTNAEIAAQLVVSVRTVDHHVSAVLQKLGVTSRREAAEIALTYKP